MKAGLTVFALLVLACLVGASVWATQHAGIMDAIGELMASPGEGAVKPWFVATLFDTYFAFLWFWLWVAYKEAAWASRILWLILICGLGNIAMAVYMLIQLLRLPPDPTAQDLLLRRA